MQEEDSEPSSNPANEQRDSGASAPKKKKKRKGLSFSSCSRRSTGSKNLQNLPSFLSDFSWIENTEANKALIAEEKAKMSEQKKLKELERLRKSQEEKASLEESKENTSLVDTTMIDQSSLEPKVGAEISLIDTTAPQTKPPTPIQDFKFTSRFDLETLDDIWERAENWYYHSLSDLVADIELIVNKSLASRCLNPLSKVYLTTVLTKSVALIKSKKEEYKTRWRAFYDAKFAYNNEHYPKVTGSWYKEAGPKRDYNRLDNYKIATPQGANPKTVGSELHLH